jgi:hypothetical protein
LSPGAVAAGAGSPAGGCGAGVGRRAAVLARDACRKRRAHGASAVTPLDRAGGVGCIKHRIGCIRPPTPAARPRGVTRGARFVTCRARERGRPHAAAPPPHSPPVPWPRVVPDRRRRHAELVGDLSLGQTRSVEAENTLSAYHERMFAGVPDEPDDGRVPGPARSPRRLAAGLGFEPRLTTPEAAVLPLHHPAEYWETASVISGLRDSRGRV